MITRIAWTNQGLYGALKKEAHATIAIESPSSGHGVIQWLQHTQSPLGNVFQDTGSERQTCETSVTYAIPQ